MAKQGKKRALSLLDFGIALGVGILVVGLSFLDIYELIELKAYDQRFIIRNQLFGPPEQLPNLATIDVDDRSVETEGRFEDWDRTWHARIVDIVGALGAKAVGIDFLLPEASTPMLREEQIARSHIGSREDALALFRNPDNVLADVARRRNNLYFAQYLTEAEDQDYDRAAAHMTPRNPDQERRFRMEERSSLPITAEHQKRFYLGTELWAPVDTLLATAKGVGQVQPIPDMDGIVRRNRALYVYDERIFPALSLVMACDYLGVPLEKMRIEPRAIVLPDARVPGEPAPRDLRIPITDRGSILINWAGDYRRTYRHYPYTSIRVFWENYQRDRLAESAKKAFVADPALREALLASFLGDMQDLNRFTLGLMLAQADLPAVDVVAAIREIAVAMRLDAASRAGQPFPAAYAAAYAGSLQPPPALARAVYDRLERNARLAAHLGENPAATIEETAEKLGVPATAIAGDFPAIRSLVAGHDGKVPPQQYPLWFFETAADDDATLSLAATIKQNFRTEAEATGQILATIASADPIDLMGLSELAVQLVARSAGFPEQDYGTVVADVLHAAVFEPLIARGMKLEEIVPAAFGGITLDLFPPELQQAFRDDYARLERNLRLARLIEADHAIPLAAAADSLGAGKTDIAGDYHMLRYLTSAGGRVPETAHPLVFYTLVVDGRPVFPSDFADAVMFYGITSTGGHDRNPMPFETRYPMVGMHLNLFNQIITGDFLHQAPVWVNALIIIAISLLMGLSIPKLSPAAGGAVMISAVAAYVVVAILLFAKGGLWIDAVGPLVVLVFSYLAITVRNYIVGEKEKKFIKGAFSAYLAPEIVEQVANDPDSLRLGGEPANITAFFSDVKGFSSISEALTPTKLVELLNEYLTEMCDIAFKHHGTVDKFIGDAIVAFFGAPIHMDDHAVRACLCSIEMQRRLAELRKRWHAEGRHEIYQRIGLNSGEMVVGNMGSRTRFNYTMMGDNVNLGARLESGAKQFGVYTMISQFTYEAAKDAIEVRELDKIVVIGKKEPVTVYELLAEKDNLDPVKRQIVTLYQDGLCYYRDQRWADAIEKFRAAAQIDDDGHGDATSLIMLERCESILKGKVEIPSVWNGVWELTSK